MIKKVIISLLILLIVGIFGWFVFGSRNRITGPTGPMCGGIAGILCPEGYQCHYDGNYPDAGGVCIKIK